MRPWNTAWPALALLLVFLLSGTSGFASPLLAGWLGKAGGYAAPAREAFITTLGAALGRDALVEIPAAEHFAVAAEKLMGRADLGLILADGPEALRALAAADNGITPVVALSPDCVPGIFAQGDMPANFLLFSPDFHVRRMETLRAITGFSRLGLIAPPPDAPEAQGLIFALMRDAANKVGGRDIGIASDGGSGNSRTDAFELFVYEDMSQTDAAGCREAADALFFDEIDALILDASACFEPGRPDFQELIELLRQRGILPLSLDNPALAAAGALLAPWEGAQARLGRELALHWLHAASVAGQAQGTPEEMRPPLFAGAGQPQFILNLNVAAAMGFDPPVALLALTRRYIGR